MESLAFFSVLEMEALCSSETFGSPKTTTSYNSVSSQCRENFNRVKLGTRFGQAMSREYLLIDMKVDWSMAADV